MQNRNTQKEHGRTQKVVAPSKQALRMIRDFARSYHVQKTKTFDLSCSLN